RDRRPPPGPHECGVLCVPPIAVGPPSTVHPRPAGARLRRQASALPDAKLGCAQVVHSTPWWAYLPMQAEEQLTIPDRLVAIDHTVQEKYGVQTVIVALPEPVQCASHGGVSGGTAITP